MKRFKKSSAPPVTPLKRTAIIVRNMRRSLAFYQGVLGMNIWIQGHSLGDIPALYELLGMPRCTVRWVILQSEDVAWGMVGLFELSKPKPSAIRRANSRRANVGEACLVFHTPDVDAIHRGARRLGLPILCAPKTLSLPVHGVESREMTLRDPNGVLLNFIQNVKGGSIGLSNRFPGVKPNRD
jgi:catechol 2,3-dioxygenase-like lactoylglutathione lyase family enzyme